MMFRLFVPVVFPEPQRRRINPLKHIIFSSQISYLFRPNMVIIRLATRRKRQIYTQLYLDWDLVYCYIQNICKRGG